MGRSAQFSEQDFLAAAERLAAEQGPGAVTIAAVAAAAGAPTGSLYHRFGSRDELLARLWLDTVKRFQSGFMAALAADDGLAAALHTPRWVGFNPLPARLLLLHRSSDFNAGHWPAQLQARADAQAAALRRALASFVRRRYGRNSAAALARVRLALIDLPYAAVRPYLESSGRLPPETEALIERAYRALMEQEL